MTSSKKTRYLEPGDIDKAIAELADRSRSYGVRIALIGGAALQLFGHDRLTKDVDVIADGDMAVTPLRALSFGGIAGVLPESRVEVDLVLRDDDYKDLYDAALDAAVHVPGVPIPVVPLEYITAMKLAAGRAKDLADLEFLVLDAGIDYRRAREIVREFMGAYAAREFDRYRDSITWERSRGGK